MTQPLTDFTRIPVIVNMDYADVLVDDLREISPRLHVERHFPHVPERAWDEVEVLYTLNELPPPERAPRLRWVQLHTAGIDHVADAPLLKAHDVEITTASGAHLPQMPEFILSMMLAFNYRVPHILQLQAEAEWPQKGGQSAQYTTFSPRELRGQTLGIVGYGTIGRELARMADGLGMRVLAAKRDVMHPEEHDAYVPAGMGDPAANLPARIYPPEAIRSMAGESDFLVVLAPLTGRSGRLINAEVLGAMKKTAVLINVARGGVIDEAALISALAAEKIAGAALDVFDEEPLPTTSPLWNLPNVILSPHIAGASSRYHRKTAEVFSENLRRYLAGQTLLNRVRREEGY